MKTFFEIIETIKELKGLKTDIEVAKLLGIKSKTLATAKTRNSIPFKELASFCSKEGVSLDLVMIKEEDQQRDKEGDLGVRESGIVYGKSKEFVSIPQVHGKIGAGGGLIPNNCIEMRIAFRRDWIQRKGNPQNMSLIRVIGDSMEPTLESGDCVLIDHSRNYVDPHGGIYAIVVHEEIMLKRLQVLYPLGKIRVISDNSKYQPVEVEPDLLKINGKVIWFGRELER